MQYIKRRPLKPQYKVYQIILPNGQNYIGMTGKSLNRRWLSHYVNKKTAISCALQAYQPNEIKLKVLAICLNVEQALKVEAEHIAQGVNLLNRSAGGESGRGKLLLRKK